LRRDVVRPIITREYSSIQGDSRVVSDLAPLFLQHKLLSHRILHCFSI
jgi:hypothetical protein